ncbi:hypothetical protein ACFVFS_09990 [Kitasatospora sp. NPDC057692]|uniref:hypothetical protein n=1 Tax=Kitasatospora sp. NPDC057692 TaxID=3346215 RepID=UPI00369AF420
MSTTRPPAPGSGGPLLAGYFVSVPEPMTGTGLRLERLTTACDCLADRLPEDGSWFATPQDALDACATVPVPAAARLYALLIPAEHTAGVVADIRAAGEYEPVLLAHLDPPPGTGTAQEPADGGHELGWEVLGYDYGMIHSWLCNNLHQDAARELGVTPDDRGLLPSREPAERLAAWANARDDTKPVTWFPAALVEWDTPVEGNGAPPAPVPPSPAPWWNRLLGLDHP